MIAVKSLWPLVKESVSQWSDDYAPSMGAALAYYTIFSIAPLIVIAIAVAGFVVRRRRRAWRDLRAASRADRRRRRDGDPGPGQERERAGQGDVRGDRRRRDIAHRRDDGIRRTAVRPRPHLGRAEVARIGASWALLRGRLLSFGMILGIGFLLLVSLVLSAGLAALAKFWDTWFEGWEFALQAVNFVVSFAIIPGCSR